MRRLIVVLAAALAAMTAGLLVAASAQADFPYVGNGTLADPTSWHTARGQAPSNWGGDWKLAATPEDPQSNPTLAVPLTKNNNQTDELCGVRGAAITDSAATMPAGSCVTAGTPVNTAFNVTTGRPDVLISVLDSGIKWNDQGAMLALRDKVRLNAGELPAPRVDLAQPFDASTGVNCSAAHATSAADYDPNGGNRAADGTIPYDVLGQGVFNLRDYACDSRVAAVMSNPHRHGPAGFVTPEDLLIAFSDGIDHDHNGFANDIVGWNFLDNTNDPYDDVQYGHGTGEARDSNAEAQSTSALAHTDLGTCPNCMVMPLRVGESFIADVNRFAQAVIYATDRGSSVVQEALGTMNSSYFARQAIDYAYNHGTAIIASAADEAAEHHNQPGALPHTIVVNSVTKYNDPLTAGTPSYLEFNGCTNFSTKITLAVPSSSCSSEATGKSAGVAGLIYSAALNAIAKGTLQPSSDCRRVDGSACPITADEVKQLMASGNIAGTTVNINDPSAAKSDGSQGADAGNGSQADDVNFAQQPEPSCSPAPTPGCTDPNSNSIFSIDEQFGFDAPLPATRRYHARKGFDEFYGYGRLNAYKAVQAVAAGNVPPQADITSPQWFAQLNPDAARNPQIEVDGYVNARSAYSCRVDVAPGGQPNNGLTGATPPGDFETVPASLASYCDGATTHTGAYRGALAMVDVAHLESRFPPGLDFTGNENGGTLQTSNGRPNTMPYAFTVRVIVSTVHAAVQMTGEDRRQMFLHRDRDLLAGFPKELQTDGASSPVLADLVGDNRNQLIVATSDGLIHAYRSDGSELPGWPVHTDSLPLHTGEPGYSDTGVGPDHYQAVIAALAAGDLFHDGRVEVVAADLGGHVYAWDGRGRLVFKQEANPAFSGAPLAGTPSWDNVRTNPRDRVEHGFLASPTLAHLDGNPNGPLDIVIAGEDRHVYAWQPDPGNVAGTPVAGFPVLVADPDKLAGVDPTTHHLTFNSNATANPGIDEDQGKLVDTTAVAQLDGPDKPPSIIVGSNEEYLVNRGDEGAINAGGLTAASLGVLGQTGVLNFANGRVYVIKSGGGEMTCSGGSCRSSAFAPGWPKKVGIIDAGLLPDVGEGVNGSPVVANLSCPSGGAGLKVGVIPDAGPAYIFNRDGSSCYGQTAGADNSLEVDFSAGHGQYDHPAFAAVGLPAFGSLDGQTTSFLAPEAGLIRSLDVAAPDYQGGQDFIAGWDTTTGQQRPGFPAEVNDLQFLTGPVVGDILGIPGQQQVIGGTASLDLAAFNAAGLPASTAWPKLTGDWTIATPTLGSFGTLDTDSGAHKVVVSLTRMGTLSVYDTPASACSPSSSPRFHHDNANSGDSTRDAVNPGVPTGVKLDNGTLSFGAPGADLMCPDPSGNPAADYQVVSSDHPITAENFTAATPVPGAPKPAAAGTAQSFVLPAGTQRYIAIRAENAAHNVGLPAVVDAGPGAAGQGGAGAGQGGAGAGPSTPGAQAGAGAGTQTGAGANTPTVAGSGHGCRAASPLAAIAAAVYRHHVLRIGGDALDRSCNSAAVNAVRIAVALRAHGRCRFLDGRGRLGAARNCARPAWIAARVGSVLAGRRASWLLRLRARLPHGAYVAFVRARDGSGRTAASAVAKSFRVRG